MRTEVAAIGAGSMGKTHAASYGKGLADIQAVLDDPSVYIAYLVDCVGNRQKPEQGRCGDARDALAIALSVEEALA